MESLTSLQLLSLEYPQVVQLMKCKSKIKSFSLSYRSYRGFLNFESVDWPLESLSIGGISLDSWISLFNSKFAANLKSLTIFPFDSKNSAIDHSVLKLFSRLESLTELDSSVDVEQGLEEILKIGKLKKLSLHGANGQSIEQIDIHLTKLECLKVMNNNIKGNQLSRLGNLKLLTTLCLKNNSIESGGEYLTSITSLTHLDLAYNGIGDDLLKDFNKLINLEYLDVCGNNIGSIGANYLSSNVNIEFLNLSYNSIEEEGVKNYRALRKLSKLYINSNKIRNGLKYLTECESLDELSVCLNDINEQMFLEFCQKSSHVKVLHISGNPIRQGIAHLVLLNNLTEVVASSCELDDSSIVKFLKAASKIKKQSTIQLFLPRNNFTKQVLKECLKYENRYYKIVKLFITDSGLNVNEMEQLERTFNHRTINSQQFKLGNPNSNQTCSIL